MVQMLLADAIKKCVSEKNAHGAGVVADTLRIKRGWNYREIYSWVNSIAPISEAEWDALMYEADTE